MLREAGLAFAFCLMDLAVYWDPLPVAGRPAEQAEIVAFALLGYLPLVWRRRAPVLVFWWLWLHGSLLSGALLYLVAPGYLPLTGMLLAVYTVATQASRRTSLIVLAAMIVPALRDGAYHAYVALLSGQAVKYFLIQTALHAVYAFVAWNVGRARLLADLNARRDVEAREAVMLERLSIARELHDIVAHAVTIMVLHTAGARRLLTLQPDRATAALDQSETMGRQAMDELRRMLVVLRGAPTRGGPAPTDSAMPERPALHGSGWPARSARPEWQAGGSPGLADLPALTNRISAAGVSVELAVHGDTSAVPPEVQLVAFRVAQEALTNVTRHAGPGAAATLTAHCAGEVLALSVVDDGRGDPQLALLGLSTGHGLRGLEERVIQTGGTLTYGPQPTGGYAVTARLPIRAGLLPTLAVTP
ncbi:sensor histidine kinase [Cryptosporangium sp. NPDC048952]|uniref:sensor histidine kinase n=1 Tax=Cryptosporangium sp. NPDC048952 TaxID=3363961 RepID=UPI003715D042